MSETKKKLLLFGIITTLGMGALLKACHHEAPTETVSISNDQQNNVEETPTPTEILTETPIPTEEMDQETNKTQTSQEVKEMIYVCDNEEVREYLDYDSVSFDEVKNALYENEKINDFYKEQISIFIATLEEKVPNIDLTCFYENLKKLNMVELSKEEMIERRGKGVAAYTAPTATETTIFILDTSKDLSTISHELLHLFNYLILETDQYVVMRTYEDQNGKGNSWSEGLTEWLNLLLFPSKTYSYVQQVKDVKIVQSILKKSNVTMAEEFAKYDYNWLYDELAKYLDIEELDQLYNYLDKEKIYTSGKKDAEQITTSEIQNKYDTLLKAMITSRAGALDSSEVYKIAKVFENSISVYFKTTYKEDKKLDSSIHDYLNQRILTTLLNYGIDKNNTVTIYKEDEEPLLYYDINQLYFAINSTKDQLTFIEKSVDDEGIVSYTDLKKIARKDFSGYNMCLLSDLIEDVDTLESITMNDVLEAYENQHTSGIQKVYE